MEKKPSLCGQYSLCSYGISYIEWCVDLYTSPCPLILPRDSPVILSVSGKGHPVKVSLTECRKGSGAAQEQGKRLIHGNIIVYIVLYNTFFINELNFHVQYI